MGEVIQQSAEAKRTPGPSRESCLGGLLERSQTLCQQSDDGLRSLAPRLAELQERLAEERFHLAVLGQFKRGKSTLLNALVGEPLLPTGIVPLTSIPTFMRAGDSRVVRVLFHDGRRAEFPNLSLKQASSILAHHVTEKENPRNQLGVSNVEVEYPSRLLQVGVVLIDTPGIGSTLQHNTAVTMSFLPQCDAALFLVSADPPITEVEQEFLKAVQKCVAKLCFVMNKIDYLNASELEDAMAFFTKALKESGITDGATIFRVSAKQGIDARIHENASLWRESGVEELQSYLLDFLSREKSCTLQLAIARKAADVVADATMHTELQRRSLELAHDELATRIRIFDEKVKEIENEAIKTTDLLAGDKKRTMQFLEDLAEKLRVEARDYLGERIAALFTSSQSPSAIEQRAKELLEEEIPPFFGAKLGAFFSAVNRKLEEVIVPYEARLADLLGSLRSAAADLFEIPYRPSSASSAFEMRHKPYWVTQKWNTSISPVSEGFSDRFFPSEIRKRRTQKRLTEEVESLIIHNVENIRWATLRNLDAAFRRISAAFDERLRETAQATRHAMMAAQLKRKQNESTIVAELARIRQTGERLAELADALSYYLDA
jgi:GTPase SAR1 family protein